MPEHLPIVAVIAVFISMGSTNTEEQQLRIASKRDDDRIAVKAKSDKTIISIHSPCGISQAVVKQADGNWPGIVMLRLHLQGLEAFKVTNGTVTLEAAVSSQDGKVRLWMDGKEESPLDVKSAYWMEIRMVSNCGKPTTSIPLRDGCFEIQLPKSLFKDNPQSITVSWIDFYR